VDWRNTVAGRQVYCLGDLSFGRGARPVTYWLRLLGGDACCIRGNHESPGCVSEPHQEIAHSGLRFLLIHDPQRLLDKYRQRDGWIIHGHAHNNMKEYPFINGGNRTINVSAEVVNYCPVDLEPLASLGLDRIKRMDTLDSPPEFWEDG